MTCTHVLGLIDAGPFAGYPRAHLDAAWRHAAQCPTCGPALEAAGALTMELQSLPQPAPPPDMTPAVLARISRIDAASSVAASTSPDWPAWTTALGSLAAVLAMVVSMPSGGPIAIDITSPRVGGMAAGVVPLPEMTTWALVLATGLVVYVAGLFAPLKS